MTAHEVHSSNDPKHVWIQACREANVTNPIGLMESVKPCGQMCSFGKGSPLSVWALTSPGIFIWQHQIFHSDETGERLKMGSIVVPPWTSPASHHLCPQPDVYGSSFLFMVFKSIGRQWKHPCGSDFAASWRPLCNRPAPTLHEKHSLNMNTKTQGSRRFRGCRQTCCKNCKVIKRLYAFKAAASVLKSELPDWKQRIHFSAYLNDSL